MQVNSEDVERPTVIKRCLMVEDVGTGVVNRPKIIDFMHEVHPS